MATKFKVYGLCACGHDPMEDPNEDCERCWLVTRISDLEIQAVEDADSLAALRERAGRLEGALQEIVDFEPVHPCVRSPYEQIAAHAKNAARLALSTPAPAGEEYRLPYRSECRCGCHEPGVGMLHFVPCCQPDPAPAGEVDCLVRPVNFTCEPDFTPETLTIHWGGREYVATLKPTAKEADQ